MKILILDGYNHQIIEGGIIGTVVPNFSRWGLTNGSKIIEVYGDDTDREFVPTKGRVCQPTRWESLSYDNSSDSKSGWRQ